MFCVNIYLLNWGKMAADVGYVVRIMSGYNNKEEQQEEGGGGGGNAKSTALITRDLLGGGGGGSSTVDSKELDLDLQVPCGYEKRLDLKVYIF